MQLPSSAIPKAMTIAGSDSGAGAGIQADLKTFAALGVYGTSAITAVTAQNTVEVLAIAEVPEDVVGFQIDAIMEDIGADAIKTGMLFNPDTVEAVADRIAAWGIGNLVVDPVMIAKSGDVLMTPEAVGAIVDKLLPLALVITPNIPEAEQLTGFVISDDQSAERAARAIHELGPRWVVIKGGHRKGAADDLVFDGREIVTLSGERIDSSNTHGTGCTFSAAITANLAKGQAPLEAIANAKSFISAAISASYAIGRGHSPVNHFHGILVS